MQRTRKIIRNKKTSSESRRGFRGGASKTMDEVEQNIKKKMELIKELQQLNTNAQTISNKFYILRPSQKAIDLQPRLDLIEAKLSEMKIVIEKLTIKTYTYDNVQAHIQKFQSDLFSDEELTTIYNLVKGKFYYAPKQKGVNVPKYLGMYKEEVTKDFGSNIEPFFDTGKEFTNETIRNDPNYKFIEVTEAPEAPEAPDGTKTGGKRKTRRYRKSKAKGMKKRSHNKK